MIPPSPSEFSPPAPGPVPVNERKRLKIKHHVIYYSAQIIIGMLLFLPISWVRVLGRTFGGWVFRLSKREKQKTLEGLAQAYPAELTSADRARLARSVWVGLGQNLFETIRWFNWTREAIAGQVARIEGMEHFHEAVKKGRGFFVVSGHLGNWELLASYLCSQGEGTAVAQSLYDPRFDDLVTWFRNEKLGTKEMIKRGLALRGILEAFKKGRFLIALCDQDTGKDGVFVPFFGKPAWTQSGVARIAYKAEVPLVPAFMVRGKDGLFELHVEKEIEIPRTGNKEADVLETVRRITAVIEKYVKTYPDQWMWMHERWKTKPKKDIGSFG